MGRTLDLVLSDADLDRPRPVRPAWAWFGVLALGGVTACTDHVPYTTDADTGSTHAFISVERSQAGEVERAGALAGFAQMPATVDSAAVLSLVGWALDLPTLGQCSARSRDRDPNTPLSPIDHVEFLEAGEVKLETAGTGTTLAPHAFPTVTDLISGVVYTSRDRSSGALPAGTRYQVRTTGGLGLGPLSVTSEAPPSLSDVTVGGSSLGSLDTFSAARRVEVTWKAGSAGDVVVVEAASVGTTTGIWCAFRDEDGSGVVPAATVNARGNGKLSVHRIRSLAFEASGVTHGELRFDFEVTRSVTITE
jgi:hypothetical protein